MATTIYYNCNKCDFSTSVHIRLRKETMLIGEGPSIYYCVICKKEVKIYSDEKTVCPYCGQDYLIGYNITVCQKCKDGKLIEEQGPSF